MGDHRTMRLAKGNWTAIHGWRIPISDTSRRVLADPRVPPRASRVSGFFLVEALLLLMIFGIVIAMTTSYASNAYRIFTGVRAAAQLRYANDVVQEFVLHYAKEIKEQLASQPNRENLTITHGDHVTLIPVMMVGAHRGVQEAEEAHYTWTISKQALTAIAALSRRLPPDALSAARLSLFPRDDDLNHCKEIATSIKNCRIETLTYRTQTISYRGSPDWLALNAGLRALKAGGALSIAIAPDALRFHRHDTATHFSRNPVAAQAGILAIRGEQAPQHQPYLDLRYGYMFGKIDIDNKGIKAAKSITANQVGLTQSATVALADSHSASTLTFSKGEVTTSNWVWKFPRLTFQTSTVLDGDQVTSQKAHVDHAITEKLSITGKPTGNTCIDWDITFDAQRKPVYCKENLWKRFE